MAKEIEKKFLVRRPCKDELEWLQEKYESKKFKIVQTYLVSDDENIERRVRAKTSYKGDTKSTKYYYTEKSTHSGLVREENERVISEEEYKELLKQKNTILKPIQKTRYQFDYSWKDNSPKKTFELDLYTFDLSQAILEVELAYENEPYDFPTFIELIADVTENPKYKNRALAHYQEFPSLRNYDSKPEGRYNTD